MGKKFSKSLTCFGQKHKSNDEQFTVNTVNELDRNSPTLHFDADNDAPDGRNDDTSLEMVFNDSKYVTDQSADVESDGVELSTPTIKKEMFHFSSTGVANTSSRKNNPMFWKFLTLPSKRSKKQNHWRNTIDFGMVLSMQQNSFNEITISNEHLSQSTGNIRSQETWPSHFKQSIFMPNYPVDHKVISSYKIKEKLGYGAYSEVFRVHDKKIETSSYALKKLSKSQIVREGMLKQAQDEISVLLKLGHHPYILSLVMCWQSKGYLYQLFPLLRNGDLFTLWTKEKTFPMTCVKHTAAEIAVALDFIHCKKIIYRDLKMENILICNTGHILLSDFGLSKHVAGLQRTATICGTLPYMAPEVASGNGYSYECDWWSLGIIIVAMVTGKFPFETTVDHKEMLQEIKTKIFDLPKMADNIQIKDVIRKLLNFRPWHRFSTLQEVSELRLFAGTNLDDVIHKTEGPLIDYI